MNITYQESCLTFSPKVSIITPVYNKENYVKRCIKSIIDQSLANIEIIIVDDFSSDSSLSILKQIGEEDSRIKLIKHTKNLGIIHARKTGLLAARGEFIAFVDADDFLDRRACEELYDFAVNNGADFVQFNAKVRDDQKILSEQIRERFSTKLGSGKYVKLSNRDIFLNYGSKVKLNLWRSFCRRDLYKKIIPYIKDDAPRRADDNLLIFFLSYFASDYAFCSESFYNYRANETSSNLNQINIDIIFSQIDGRAKALDYAKSFAQDVGLTWDYNSQPFNNFTLNLISYSVFFLKNGLKNLEIQEKKKLLKHFGDCFKGDSLMFFSDSILDSNGNILNARELSDEMRKLKSSISWKITDPLRRISKIFFNNYSIFRYLNK